MAIDGDLELFSPPSAADPKRALAVVPPASEVIDWIDRLENPHGDLAGEPFGLLPHECELIEAICSHIEVSWSCGRGQRKTVLAAAVTAAYVSPDGPWRHHAPDRQAVIVAASGEQASLALNDVAALLGERFPKALSADSPSLRRWSAEPYGGGEVKVVSSNPRTAHGLRPGLVIADEMAQWSPGTVAKMLAALRTARGKVPGSRFVAIGTRSHLVDHPFAKMLDATGPGVWAKIYAAAEGDSLGDPATWAKAMPSLTVLPTLREAVAQEWQQAQRDPEQLAAFKALRLNMGTRDTVEALVLDADVWTAAEGDPPADGPVCWGFDLGGVSAMSAAAGYWPQTGRLEVLAFFPGVPELERRGLSDGVGGLYRDMADRGELLTVPGSRTVPPSEVVSASLDRFGPPVAISGDRYRKHELLDAFQAAGVPKVPVTWANLGWKDSAESLRRFRRSILEGRCRPLPSLLLRAALAEARTVTDPAGNERLAVKAQGGRRPKAKDDALAAAILAVSIGEAFAAANGDAGSDDDDLILAVT